MWPRPAQQPHPPIWMPVVGSKESIGFAARHGQPITWIARHIIRYGNFTETELQRQTGYSTAVSTDYVSPENRRAAQFAREDFRGLTIADVER
jgi:hypothetical protein